MDSGLLSSYQKAEQKRIELANSKYAQNEADIIHQNEQLRNTDIYEQSKTELELRNNETDYETNLAINNLRRRYAAEVAYARYGIQKEKNAIKHQETISDILWNNKYGEAKDREGNIALKLANADRTANRASLQTELNLKQTNIEDDIALRQANDLAYQNMMSSKEKLLEPETYGIEQRKQSREAALEAIARANQEYGATARELFRISYEASTARWQEMNVYYPGNPLTSTLVGAVGGTARFADSLFGMAYSAVSAVSRLLTEGEFTPRAKDFKGFSELLSDLGLNYDFMEKSGSDIFSIGSRLSLTYGMGSTAESLAEMFGIGGVFSLGIKGLQSVGLAGRTLGRMKLARQHAVKTGDMATVQVLDNVINNYGKYLNSPLSKEAWYRILGSTAGKVENATRISNNLGRAAKGLAPAMFAFGADAYRRMNDIAKERGDGSPITLMDAFASANHILVDYASAFSVLNMINKIKGPSSALSKAIKDADYGKAGMVLLGETAGNATFEGVGEMIQTYWELQGKHNYTLPDFLTLVTDPKYESLKNQIKEAGALGAFGGAVLGLGSDIVSARREAKDLANEEAIAKAMEAARGDSNVNTRHNPQHEITVNDDRIKQQQNIIRNLTEGNNLDNKTAKEFEDSMKKSAENYQKAKDENLETKEKHSLEKSDDESAVRELDRQIKSLKKQGAKPEAIKALEEDKNKLINNMHRMQLENRKLTLQEQIIYQFNWIAQQDAFKNNKDGFRDKTIKAMQEFMNYDIQIKDKDGNLLDKNEIYKRFEKDMSEKAANILKDANVSDLNTSYNKILDGVYNDLQTEAAERANITKNMIANAASEEASELKANNTETNLTDGQPNQDTQAQLTDGNNQQLGSTNKSTGQQTSPQNDVTNKESSIKKHSQKIETMLEEIRKKNIEDIINSTNNTDMLLYALYMANEKDNSNMIKTLQDRGLSFTSVKNYMINFNDDEFQFDLAANEDLKVPGMSWLSARFQNYAFMPTEFVNPNNPKERLDLTKKEDRSKLLNLLHKYSGIYRNINQLRDGKELMKFIAAHVRQIQTIKDAEQATEESVKTSREQYNKIVTELAEVITYFQHIMLNSTNLAIRQNYETFTRTALGLFEDNEEAFKNLREKINITKTSLENLKDDIISNEEDFNANIAKMLPTKEFELLNATVLRQARHIARDVTKTSKEKTKEIKKILIEYLDTVSKAMDNTHEDLFNNDYIQIYNDLKAINADLNSSLFGGNLGQNHLIEFEGTNVQINLQTYLMYMNTLAIPMAELRFNDRNFLMTAIHNLLSKAIKTNFDTEYYQPLLNLFDNLGIQVTASYSKDNEHYTFTTNISKLINPDTELLNTLSATDKEKLMKNTDFKEAFIVDGDGNISVRFGNEQKANNLLTAIAKDLRTSKDMNRGSLALNSTAFSSKYNMFMEAFFAGAINKILNSTDEFKELNNGKYNNTGSKWISTRTLEDEITNFAFDMLGINSQFNEHSANAEFRRDMAKAFVPVALEMIQQSMVYNGNKVVAISTENGQNIVKISNEANEALSAKYAYYFNRANKIPKYNAMFNGIYSNIDDAKRQIARNLKKFSGHTTDQSKEIEIKSIRKNVIKKVDIDNMLESENFLGLKNIKGLIQDIQDGKVNYITDEAFEELKKAYASMSVEDRNKLDLANKQNPFNYLELTVWNNEKNRYERRFYSMIGHASNLDLSNDKLTTALDINLDSLTTKELVEKALDKSMTRKREISDAIFISGHTTKDKTSLFYSGNLNFEEGVYYSHNLLPVGRVSADNTRFNIMSNKLFRGLTNIQNTPQETLRYSKFYEKFKYNIDPNKGKMKDIIEAILAIQDDNGNNMGLEFFNDFLAANMLIFDEDKIKHNLATLEAIEKEANIRIADKEKKSAVPLSTKEIKAIRNKVIREFGKNILDFGEVEYKDNQGNIQKQNLVELFTKMLERDKSAYNIFEQIVKQLDMSKYDRATASVATKMIDRWRQAFTNDLMPNKAFYSKVIEDNFGWADGTATGMIENILHTSLEPAVAMLSRAYNNIIAVSNNQDITKKTIDKIIKNFTATQGRATTLVEVLKLETDIKEMLSDHIVGEPLEKADIYALIAATQRAVLNPLANINPAVKWLLESDMISRDGVKKMVNKPVYSGSELYVLLGLDWNKPNDFFIASQIVLNANINSILEDVFNTPFMTAYTGKLSEMSDTQKNDIYANIQNILNNIILNPQQHDKKKVATAELLKEFLTKNYQIDKSDFQNLFRVSNTNLVFNYDKVFEEANYYFKSEVQKADAIQSKLNYGRNKHLLNILQTYKSQGKEFDIKKAEEIYQALTKEGIKQKDLDNILGKDTSLDYILDNNGKLNGSIKSNIKTYIDNKATNKKGQSVLDDARKNALKENLEKAFKLMAEIRQHYPLKNQEDTLATYSIINIFANPAIEQAFQPLSPTFRANKYSNEVMKLLRDTIGPKALAYAIERHLLNHLRKQYPSLEKIYNEAKAQYAKERDIAIQNNQLDSRQDLAMPELTLAAILVSGGGTIASQAKLAMQRTNNKAITDLQNAKNKFIKSYIKNIVVGLVRDEIVVRLDTHKDSEQLAGLKREIEQSLEKAFTDNFIEKKFLGTKDNNSIITGVDMNALVTWIGNVAPLLNQTIEASVVSDMYLNRLMKASVYDELIAAIGNIANTAKAWNIGFTRTQSPDVNKSKMLVRFAEKLIYQAAEQSKTGDNKVEEKSSIEGTKSTLNEDPAIIQAMLKVKEKALFIFLTTGQLHPIYMKNIMNAVSNSEDMFFDTIYKDYFENDKNIGKSDKTGNTRIENLYGSFHKDFKDWLEGVNPNNKTITEHRNLPQTVDFRGMPRSATLLAEMIKYVDEQLGMQVNAQRLRIYFNDKVNFMSFVHHLHNTYNVVISKGFEKANLKHAEQQSKDFEQKFKQTINTKKEATKNFISTFFGKSIERIEKLLYSLGLGSENLKVYSSNETALIDISKNNILKNGKIYIRDIFTKKIVNGKPIITINNQAQTIADYLGISNNTCLVHTIIENNKDEKLSLEDLIKLKQIQDYRLAMKEFIESIYGDKIKFNDEYKTFSIDESKINSVEKEGIQDVINAWNESMKSTSLELKEAFLVSNQIQPVSTSNGVSISAIEINNHTISYNELFYTQNLEQYVTDLIGSLKNKNILVEYKSYLDSLNVDASNAVFTIPQIADDETSSFNRIGLYFGNQNLYIGENIIDSAIKANLGNNITPDNNFKNSNLKVLNSDKDSGVRLYSRGNRNTSNQTTFYQAYEQNEESFFNDLSNDLQAIRNETQELNPFLSLAEKIGRGIAKYTKFYRENSSEDSYFAPNYRGNTRNAQTISKIVITNAADKYTRLHELFHALTYHAQHSNNPKTKFLIRQLDELIDIVLQDFESNPALQEHIFGSTEQYRNYFRTVKSYRVKIGTEIKEFASDIAAIDSIRQEFIAVAGSNPKFAKYLSNKTINKAQMKKMQLRDKLASQTDILAKFMTYGRYLIGLVSSMVFETFSQNRDYNGVEIMTELIEGLANFNEYQEESKLSKATKQINRYIKQGLDLATFKVIGFIDRTEGLSPEQKAERKKVVEQEVAESIKKHNEFISNMVRVAHDSGVSTAKVIGVAAYTALRLTFSKLMLSSEHRQVYLRELGRAMAEILDNTSLDFSEFFINFKNYNDNKSFVGQVKRLTDEVHGINQIYEIEKEQEYIQTKNTIQALIKSKEHLMKKLDTPEKMQKFEEAMTALILNAKIYDNIVYSGETNDIGIRQDYITRLMSYILDHDHNAIKHLINIKRNYLANVVESEYSDMFINELHHQAQELAITRLTRLEGRSGVQNIEMALQNAYDKVKSQKFKDGKITEEQLLSEELKEFTKEQISVAHQLVTLQTSLFVTQGINTDKSALAENVNYTRDKINWIRDNLTKNDLYKKVYDDIISLTRAFSTVALEYQRQQSYESSLNYEIGKGFYENNKDLLLDKDTEKHIFTQNDKFLYGKNGAWYKDNHVDYGFNQETSIKVVDLRAENGKTIEDVQAEEDFLKSIGYVEYRRSENTAIYVYNFKFISPNNPTKIFGHKRYADKASGKVTGPVYNPKYDGLEKQVEITFNNEEKRKERLKSLADRKSDFITYDYTQISNRLGNDFLDDIPASLAGSEHLYRSNISQKEFEAMSNVDTSISNLLGNTASNIYEKNHQARNNTAVWYNVLKQQEELLRRIPNDPNRKAHHMVPIAHIIDRSFRDIDGYTYDNAPELIVQFDEGFKDKYKVNFTTNDARDLLKLMQVTGHSYKEGDTIYIDTRFIAMLFGYKTADLTDTKWAKERPKLIKIIKGIQSFLRIAVKETKNNEVIRNPLLVAKNYISNLLGLWALGVPVNEIANGLAFYHKELENYFSLYQEKIKIETELNEYKKRVNSKESMQKKSAHQDRLQVIKGKLAANKMYPLIKEGLYTNIIEDADTADNLDKKILDMLQDKGVLKKEIRNSKIGSIVGELALSPSSESYNFLARWTRYGDIIPRAILYYNRLSSGSSHKEAINETRNVYISYASPLYGKTLRNLDHYGFTYYMKYHTNVIPVVLNTFKNNPLRSLLVMSAQLGLNFTLLQSYLVDNMLMGAITEGKVPMATPNIMHIGSLNRFKNIF